VTEKRAAFYQEVLRRVSGLPGVEQAAVGSPAGLPISNSRNQSAFVIEKGSAELERVPVAQVARVSAGYFDVLVTPLRKGRVFTEAENGASVLARWRRNRAAYQTCFGGTAKSRIGRDYCRGCRRH